MPQTQVRSHWAGQVDIIEETAGRVDIVKETQAPTTNKTWQQWSQGWWSPTGMKPCTSWPAPVYQRKQIWLTTNLHFYSECQPPAACRPFPFCWASSTVRCRWTIRKGMWGRLLVSGIIVEKQQTSFWRMFYCQFGVLLFWTILCLGKAFAVRSGWLREWTLRIGKGFTFPFFKIKMNYTYPCNCRWLPNFSCKRPMQKLRVRILLSDQWLGFKYVSFEH